jgi:hypothetical protein
MRALRALLFAPNAETGDQGSRQRKRAQPCLRFSKCDEAGAQHLRPDRRCDRNGMTDSSETCSRTGIRTGRNARGFERNSAITATQSGDSCQQGIKDRQQFQGSIPSRHGFMPFAPYGT